MTTTGKNNKRSASTSSPLVSTSTPSRNVINGLLDCYNFLTPNEYSEKTIGLLAFLTRQSVGEINFSDLLDELEKRGQIGQPADIITLLENKRDNLNEIEASIEKCLMINRIIKYIQENKSQFMSIISHIRLEMKMKMTDNHMNQTIQYPDDFRQRRNEFFKRKYAQDIRHLFYLNDSSAKEPRNLIYLKNRTFEHLNYLLECKMRYETPFRDMGIKELFDILNTSFMIIAHPHCGVNPVTIYDRKAPGEYTAKISVIIVSLLHDFIQQHPNMIELYDIEPSLWPFSLQYKLIEPRTISWKTCQLQGCPGDKPQIIQYAELSFITIQQASKKDTRVHFAQLIHTLKFSIRLHVNLTEYQFAKTHQFTIESLPFGIGQHNNQIPVLLTRVILDDIRRFSRSSTVEISKIANFLQRYFIHRIGVKPNAYLDTYLAEELTKAKNEKKNFQTLEDIYMDFVVPFVHQVEFMSKHPVLAMFYADGLFLGICNSKRVGEVMMQSSDLIFPKVALRMNSVETDYNTTAKLAVSGRTIKLKACAVRVDIYTKNRRKIQNRTFNSVLLPNDLSSFVSTARFGKSDNIYILSTFSDKTNHITYKSYQDFTKYYHERLHQISKADKKYKLVTNLIEHINNGDDEDSMNPDSISPATIDHECLDSLTNTDAMSSTSSHRYENIVQKILAKPELVTELIRQMTLRNLIPSVQHQPQFSYEQHAFSLPNLYNSNNFNQSRCVIEDSNSQQNLTDVQNMQISDNSLSQIPIDLFDFMTTDQTPFITSDQDFQRYVEDLTNDPFSLQDGQ